MNREVKLSRWDQGDGKHCLNIDTGRHTTMAVGCYDHCPGMYNKVSFFELSVDDLEGIGFEIMTWARELRIQKANAERETKEKHDQSHDSS